MPHPAHRGGRKGPRRRDSIAPKPPPPPRATPPIEAAGAGAGGDDDGAALDDGGAALDDDGAALDDHGAALDDGGDDDPRLRPEQVPDAQPLGSPTLLASLPLAALIYAANSGLAGAAGAALPALLAASPSSSPGADTAAMATALLSTLAHGGQLAATVALLRLVGGVDWSGAVVAERTTATTATTATTTATATAPPSPQQQQQHRQGERWWRLEWGAWPVVQGVSAGVVALGIGALVATASQGAEADGSLEWRELLRTAAAPAEGGATGAPPDQAAAAASAAAAAAAAARVAGAVVLAPAWEELYCRGLLAAAARPYVGPAGGAAFSALAFAALLHPPAQFPQQLSLGLVLSLSALAARGNLAVPFLGHALYNAGVLAAGAAAGGSGGAAGSG